MYRRFPRPSLIAAILTLIAALGVAHQAAAQVPYYVDAAIGSDSNTGASATVPWRTIQKAFDAAPPGSTVFIKGGVYRESLVLRVSGSETAGFTTFRNFGSDTVIIDATGITASPLIEIWSKRYVRIQGLDIRNYINDWGFGIRISEGSDHIEIRQNKLSNMKIAAGTTHNVIQQGIQVRNHPIYVSGTDPVRPTDRIIIDGNDITDCEEGWGETIDVSGNATNWEITNNRISRCQKGIDATGHFGESSNPANDQARNGLIRGNVVSDMGVDGIGIYVDGGKDIVIERNTILRNEWGIVVSCEVQGKTTSGVIVRDNLVSDANGGIAVGGWTTAYGRVVDSQVLNNTVVGIGVGAALRLTLASRIVFTNNILSGSSALVSNQVDTDDTNTFNYNLFDSTTGFGAGWKGIWYTNFASYRQVSGQDGQSLLADPRFVNRAAKDFHLTSTSAAIDTGNPSFVAAQGELDLDGQSRVAGSRVDIGSDEFTSGSATPPTISQHPASQTVLSGQPVTFTVGASGTAPLSYQWQRNSVPIGGANGSTYTINAVAAADNGARFRCVVTNSVSSATSNEATLTVTPISAPTPNITQPAVGALYSGGDTITYAGTGVDASGNNLPASAFTWRVDFYHDGLTDPFMAATSGSTSGTFTIPRTGSTSANVWYRISLTVTDSGGRTATTFRDVLPRTVTITLASSPSGLQLTLDGQAVTTGYAFTGVVGMFRTIGVPASQTSNGVTYTFGSWSDLGAAAHQITTPSTATTYTATMSSPSGGGGPSQTLLTTQTPAFVNAADGNTYELGVRVLSDVAGQITAVRFYKGTSDTGTHVGRVWNAAGTQLASVTFVNESASGWQTQALTSPVAVTANVEYVVSVSTGPGGFFPATVNGLASVLTNAHLRTPGDGGGRAGTVGTFPANVSPHNYFRDLTFVPAGGGPVDAFPNVSLTQPTATTVSGTGVTLAATATDDKGVAGVQFQVDGVNVGSEITTAPYTVSWNSTAVTNASHTIAAIARDTIGQKTTATKNVTVANPDAFPTVSLTQPTATTVSGTGVTLAATANDDKGVAGVQFQVDGVNVGSEITTAPYTVSWNSTTVTNASHTIAAIARDTIGQKTTATLNVTVSNQAPSPGPSQTLLTTQTPQYPSANDGRTYELGVRVLSDVAGQITAVRFYKAASDTGTHIGRVWSASGTQLASVTFVNETASGWQTQALTTPVTVAANVEFVVSVSTGPGGFFPATVNGFAGVVTNGHLRTPSDGGGRAGTLGTFPTNVSPHNYFRDLTFVAN